MMQNEQKLIPLHPLHLFPVESDQRGELAAVFQRADARRRQAEAAFVHLLKPAIGIHPHDAVRAFVAPEGDEFILVHRAVMLQSAGDVEHLFTVGGDELAPRAPPEVGVHCAPGHFFEDAFAPLGFAQGTFQLCCRREGEDFHMPRGAVHRDGYQPQFQLFYDLHHVLVGRSARHFRARDGDIDLRGELLPVHRLIQNGEVKALFQFNDYKLPIFRHGDVTALDLRVHLIVQLREKFLYRRVQIRFIEIGRGLLI